MAQDSKVLGNSFNALDSQIFCDQRLLKTTTTFLSDPTVLLCILRALVPRVSKLLCICILHTASLTIFHLLPFPVIFRAAINCEGEFQDCVLFYVKSQRLVRNFLIQRVSFFFNFENGHD